jgi:eukaryotic-like serine/threonine-protein kinase
MISFEVGTSIAGKYRLERALARGGMGSVWVARHLHLDVEVAIKFMAPELAASAEGRARFEREAKASAQLKTANVVQIHDYGIEDDTPYLVMELLEGDSLETRLRREGRLSLPATLAIVEPVCKALRRAHEVGLVHRDLKPGNIFIARQGGGEEIVKVLDFGIAKSLDPAQGSAVTRTGTLLGSPAYMSPEQTRRSKQIDHRSDLWSLGVVVFECLTGQVPFVGEEIVDLLVAICRDPIPIPSTLVPSLGPEVDRFLARSLAREPEQRFQSAPEFAQAFAELVLAGGPRPSTAEDRPPMKRSPAVSLPDSATLSPASHTLASTPSQGSRPSALLVAAGAGAALGLSAFAAFFFLRAPAPAPGAMTEGEPRAATAAVLSSPAAPSAALSAAPPDTTPSAAPSAAPLDTAPSAAPAAPPLPLPSSDTDAARRAPPSPQVSANKGAAPPKGTAPVVTRKKNANDLLNQR